MHLKISATIASYSKHLGGVATDLSPSVKSDSETDDEAVRASISITCHPQSGSAC
jgi:hypothetical protein